MTKRYDPGVKGPGAVNDLSMIVPAGRICVLVGPSGCGKTTSLKMVNRLIEPTSGSILIDGRDIAQEDPIALRRRIGYVIQQVGLFPHQTIGANVATVPRLLGWDVERRRARTDELLELVGLDPARYRDRYPSQLSGGERQRVGVARALAADPPVLLMDEPFGAVDPIVRERLQDELLRLQARMARTILFVTHDIDEAVRWATWSRSTSRAASWPRSTPRMRSCRHRPPTSWPDSWAWTGASSGCRCSRVRRPRRPRRPSRLAWATPRGDARARLDAQPESPWLLLSDAQDRPLGWVHERRVPAEGVLGPDIAEPTNAILTPSMSLRDALSVMLDEQVITGVVVDAEGRVTGTLTIDQLAAALH